jgi:tRNA pseudouridine32 synthase / 23S rRNA pseudouridine746 synthase
MGISKYPSSVTMPNSSAGCSTVLDFLIKRFPRIKPDIWLQRIHDGKVQWEDKTSISEYSPYSPHKRILYYREAEQEPDIPFSETILYQDEQLLVVDKPHFMPVIPNGNYVRQSLIYRLRSNTGIDTLTPIHRIDRYTAGVVMFSINPETRGKYQMLFANGLVTKTYHAIATIPPNSDLATQQLPRQWLVENRIVSGDPWFRMTVTDGEINARTRIECIEVNNAKGLFHLYPLTGKTHQLRLHMSGLGMPLLNERYYPELHPESEDDFKQPLQLLAKRLEFIDPITAEPRDFCTCLNLTWQ